MGASESLCQGPALEQWHLRETVTASGPLCTPSPQACASNTTDSQVLRGASGSSSSRPGAAGLQAPELALQLSAVTRTMALWQSHGTVTHEDRDEVTQVSGAATGINGDQSPTPTWQRHLPARGRSGQVRLIKGQGVSGISQS